MIEDLDQIDASNANEINKVESLPRHGPTEFARSYLSPLELQVRLKFNSCLSLFNLEIDRQNLNESTAPPESIRRCIYFSKLLERRV